MSMTEERKLEMLNYIQSIKTEDIKTDKKNIGFDRFGRMIIYKYYPRCVYCNDVNKGMIVKTQDGEPVWQCKKCKKLTESTNIIIEAPEY